MAKAAPVAVFAEPQIGHRAAAGMHRNANMADIGTSNLPRQRQAVGKAIIDPIGGKFGGQKQVESSGFFAERAEINRANPLAV